MMQSGFIHKVNVDLIDPETGEYISSYELVGKFVSLFCKKFIDILKKFKDSDIHILFIVKSIVIT
jgi:hypothetical protein